MDAYMIRQRDEAIAAGEQALVHLRAAETQLEKAKTWGMFDMLGRGILTTAMKRARMQEAQTILKTAQQALDRFSRELSDVRGFGSIHLESNDFLSFADFFFDGLLVDYMVQKRIVDALQQTRYVIIQVEDALAHLRSLS